jgi:hypothetical protein
VGLRRAPDVQVDELVEQRLQDIAGADPRIGGDREPKLGGNREAEPVRAAAGATHLQLGLARGQRAGGEDGHLPQPGHLFTKVDPRNLEVRGMAPQLLCPSNL